MEPRYLISYGAMHEVAVFTGDCGARCERGQQVVVETDRGVEWGEVLAEAKEDASETSEANGDETASAEKKWRLLRRLEATDEQVLSDHAVRRQEEFDVWRKRLARLSLPVELVDVEYLLTGDTVVLYVLAVEGSDFTAISETLSKISGKRLLFQRFGDDPTAPKPGGCSGNCTCGSR